MSRAHRTHTRTPSSLTSLSTMLYDIYALLTLLSTSPSLSRGRRHRRRQRWLCMLHIRLRALQIHIEHRVVRVDGFSIADAIPWVGGSLGHISETSLPFPNGVEHPPHSPALTKLPSLHPAGLKERDQSFLWSWWVRLSSGNMALGREAETRDNAPRIDH